MAVVELTDAGLYCPDGDFFIDPWKPVARAVITHAHSDHARVGHGHYIATPTAREILKYRLGAELPLETKDYGERFKVGNCWVSLHPAGHVLGSAQVRVERGSEVWVASGDYKRGADPSCEPFEVQKCDVFISEATFALPVYGWDDSATIARDIWKWKSEYQDGASLLFAYAFGKTQRVLAELANLTDETVYLHGSAEAITSAYRKEGIRMVPTERITDQKGDFFKGKLIIAPPSAHRSVWMKRFKNPQTGFASGWMLIRGNRIRRGYERGFALSDHADWRDLITTIEETGAKKVYLTHGQTDAMVQYLREKGLDCQPLKTQFEGEAEST